MQGLRYLAKNVGILTIGQFGTKLISFCLTPLYTYVLSTAEYGTWDFLVTTMSLITPFLTLNIGEAALRFPLDKGSDHKAIFSICCHYMARATIMCAAIVLANHFLGLVPLMDDYRTLFILLFAVSAFNGILSNFSRGIDCVKAFTISGVISSAALIGFNILFLVVLRMGVVGFYWANILGTLTQFVYLFFSMRCWKYIKRVKLPNPLQHDMLSYSRPLILSSVSWWINGVSNRYVITWFCGVAANGVFSISYKIPTILTMFQGIFSQAWVMSATNEFDKDDKNGFFSKIYAAYNFMMVLASSVLIALSRIIASFLYSGDFYVAWRYVPFLLISTVFGAAVGYTGGILSAVKKTQVIATTTMMGAGINLLLNLLLVWKIGIMGAAVAAAVSYGIILIIRLWSISKYITLQISYLRDWLSYGLLFLQTALLLKMNDSILFYSIQILLVVTLLAINKSTLSIISSKGIKIINSRLRNN